MLLTFDHSWWSAVQCQSYLTWAGLFLHVFLSWHFASGLQLHMFGIWRYVAGDSCWIPQSSFLFQHRRTAFQEDLPNWTIQCAMPYRHVLSNALVQSLLCWTTCFDLGNGKSEIGFLGYWSMWRHPLTQYPQNHNFHGEHLGVRWQAPLFLGMLNTGCR